MRSIMDEITSLSPEEYRANQFDSNQDEIVLEFVEGTNGVPKLYHGDKITKKELFGYRYRKRFRKQKFAVQIANMIQSPIKPKLNWLEDFLLNKCNIWCKKAKQFKRDMEIYKEKMEIYIDTWARSMEVVGISCNYTTLHDCQGYIELYKEVK